MQVHAPNRRILSALLTAATLAIPAVSPASAQVLGPAPGPAAGDGRAIPVPGMPQTFDPAAALNDLNLKPIGPLERKRRHYEVEAVMQDGRRVSVTFDMMGRVSEIEREEFEPDRSAGLVTDPAPLLERVRQAGFGYPAVSELKRHHAVIRATTQKNEPIELHVDNAGTIYKQVWLR
jgi:hypothetical protein